MNETQIFIPKEFISLTVEQKYNMIVIESTKITAQTILDLVLLSLIVGILFGGIVVILYFQFKKNKGKK